MSYELAEAPLPVEADSSPPATILVVDDDESIVEVLSYRLKRQGFSVLTATTGKAALDVALREPIDLILLDLRLPDTDGFDVCRKLVDSPKTCGIPVIILSGMERSDIIRLSRAAGCQFFIRKPYDPNVLLMLIRQSIDG